jgi:hypothetical protein
MCFLVTGKETEPPILFLWEKLTDMLYIPGVGERACGALLDSELALEPGPDFKLPTMHEPLVVALERLVVPCISDCCSPPVLVDEVHILTS